MTALNFGLQNRRIAIFLLFLVIFCLAAAGAARRLHKHDYLEVMVNCHQARVAEIDLKTSKVDISPVLAEPGGQRSADIIAKWRPRAAINGTYFDSTHRTLGDVVRNKTIICRCGLRSAIAVTDKGRVEFRRRARRERFGGTYTRRASPQARC